MFLQTSSVGAFKTIGNQNLAFEDVSRKSYYALIISVNCITVKCAKTIFTFILLLLLLLLMFFTCIYSFICFFLGCVSSEETN